MSAALVLGVAGAGAVGAAARFVVDGAVRSRWPRPFPLGTLVVNIGGSLLLGVLTGLVLFHGSPDVVRIVLGTGFCGGYTTFGTASFETVRLSQQGLRGAATLNAVATAAASLAAASAGLLLTSW